MSFLRGRVRPVCWVAWVGLVLAAPAGCSKARPPQIVVSGVVSYDGEPVWQGKVLFLGVDNRVVSAEIEPDGSYRVINPSPGLARVAVTNFPTTVDAPVDQSAAERPGVARSAAPPRPWLTLPDRYAEPFRSGLSLFLQPGEVRQDLRLERLPDDPPVVRKDDLPAVGVEVGQTAPDISGPDLGGAPLRLSEQRGKVVALLFWGYW
ncbi:MAG: hypothetical protein U0736_06350 [Gemmataceae bacterium]